LFEWPRRGPFQLTNGPLAVFFPSPSADGKRLFVAGYQARNEFLRYDLNSGQLLPKFGEISGTDLEFSMEDGLCTFLCRIYRFGVAQLTAPSACN